MSTSLSVRHYLEDSQVNYDVVHHSFSQSAYDSACSSHLPTANIIKSVVLRNTKDGQYVIAMIPATHRLKLNWVNQSLGGPLILAKEMELAELLPDCRLGAVPALGQPYGLKMIWDDTLKKQKDLYFEAGDHENLIHLKQDQFEKLFQEQQHETISVPAEMYSLYHSDELRGTFN